MPTLTAKNTLNNNSNANNILLTNLSNQPEYNIDSFRVREKTEFDRNGPLVTNIK